MSNFRIVRAFATIESMDSTSLQYLHQPAPRMIRGGNPLLLLLHGYGSTEADLFGLASFLDDRLAIASARAPYAHPGGGRAWYSLEITERGMRQNLVEAGHSRLAIANFIGQLRRAHAPSKLFLGGFSQGAMMSCSVALAEPSLVDGVVLMSGALWPAGNSQPSAALPPFIVTHGTLDDTLPVARGRALRDHLLGLGAQVAYHEYAMSHEISEACLEDVNAWLAARM